MTLPGGEMELGVYPRDERFRFFLREQMLSAAMEALASLRPIKVEYVAIPLPGIAFNRRTIRKNDGLV